MFIGQNYHNKKLRLDFLIKYLNNSINKYNLVKIYYYKNGNSGVLLSTQTVPTIININTVIRFINLTLDSVIEIHSFIEKNKN